MPVWKIELGPKGPEQLKYRAVIEAECADVAIAEARRRFPLLAKAGCNFQAMDDRELADLDAAAERFMQ